MSRGWVNPILTGAAAAALAGQQAFEARRAAELDGAVRDVGNISPESLVDNNGLVTALKGNTGYNALVGMLRSPDFVPPKVPIEVGLATTPTLTVFPGGQRMRVNEENYPFAVHVGIRGIRGLRRHWSDAPVNPKVSAAVEEYADRYTRDHDGAAPRPNLLLDFQGALPKSIPQFSNQVDWATLQKIITAAGGVTDLRRIVDVYEHGFAHEALADPVLKLLAGALALAHRDYEVAPGNPEDNRKYHYASRMLTLTLL